MKEAEDDFFRFVFTWIEGGRDKGWVTHYRAKHMPLSPEFDRALAFLGGFSLFSDCPEFEFDQCWWRFVPYENDDRDPFNQCAAYAHGHFDAHVEQFSPGIRLLLDAHAELEKFGLSFLHVDRIARAGIRSTARLARSTSPGPPSGSPSTLTESFDVAISFAGPERPLAERLATRVQGAGFKVFYDGFYPEQLWGKDLVVLFDDVYRKQSRYCVMFVSESYAKRLWTSHERRSAQARALEEKGQEYILPVRVDDTDLDGLPPTMGYLSLDEYSVDQIADLLIEKLAAL